MREFFRTLIIALVFAMTVPVLSGLKAQADTGGGGETETIKSWQQRLQAIGAELAQEPDLSSAHLQELEIELQKLIANARDLQIRTQKQMQPLQAQIDSLGPAPTEGGASESPQIAKTRQTLQTQVTQLQGYIQQTELLITQAQAGISQIGQLDQSLMAARLLTRLPPPFDPRVWQQGASQLSSVIRHIQEDPAIWWQASKDRGTGGIIIAAAVIICVLGLIAWPIRRWILHRWGPRPAIAEPNYKERILGAAAAGIANILIPIAVLAALMAILNITTAEGISFVAIANLLGNNLIIFFLITGLAAAAFSPKLTAWRLFPVPTKGAKALYRRIVLLDIIFIVFNVTAAGVVRHGEPAPEYFACLAFISHTLIAGIMLSMLPWRFWRDKDAGPIRPLWLILHGAAWPIFIVVPLITLAGYAFLSGYILRVIVTSIVVIGATLLLRAALLETIHALAIPKKDRAKKTNDADIGAKANKSLLFWSKALVDVILWPPVLYLLLINYGVSASLLNARLRQAFAGIRIGSINLSLFDIFAAIATLSIGLFLVNVGKKWLNDKILPAAQIDSGLKHSLVTGFGYTGSLLVLVFAIMMLGMDLSSIALVAGAFSVGLGFGLKMIVENFVSGIMILAGRPIKVGDWIVVGDIEGIVKRIAVRSTEIETASRASIIVPNSTLIAQPVMNWTHRDRTVGIKIKIGVSYESDTRKVRDVLLACAAAHEKVLKMPAPRVALKAFGQAALEFELTCFIRDASDYGLAQSELYFAIDDAFRANNIDIPFETRKTRITTPIKA